MPIFYALLFVGRFWIFRAILEVPPMVWIGRLSYSLYLSHLAVLFFVGHLLPNASLAVQFSIDVPLFVGLAALSYYAVERPCQRLRKMFRRV